MVGMDIGITTMAATISITGAHGEDRTVTGIMCATPAHLRQSMSHPLLLSLKSLTHNPNLFITSQQLRIYSGNIIGIIKKWPTSNFFHTNP
jgi:hypothetical protein